MSHSDELLRTYYSLEVEEHKRKARSALAVCMVSGLMAIGLFALFGLLVFTAVLGVNPLGTAGWVMVVVMGVPALAGLVVASWVFSARFLWMTKRAKDAVDTRMRAHVAGVPVSGGVG